MNKFARLVQSKTARISALASVGFMSVAAHAQAASGFDAALDAVDLAGLAVKVGAAGLLIIGIAIAFKGPTLAKRVVSKV